MAKPDLTAGPIACYLADLGSRLLGRASWRRDVLAEVEDGLLCAALANMADGRDRARAERLAVARWGDAERIAADYNQNAARLMARQLSRHALALTPLLALVWASTIERSPAGPWPHRPMSVTIGLVLMIGGGTLALVGATLSARASRGVGARREPGPGEIGGALAAGHGLLLAIITSIVMVAHRGIPHPHSLSWSWAALATLLSVAGLVRLTLLMRGCGRARAAVASEPTPAR